MSTKHSSPMIANGIKNNEESLADGHLSSAPTGARVELRLWSPRELAQRLVAWLEESGAKPGDRIGDRAGLADLWGVSASTMREAVRILEAAGILEQKVGAGGGVFFQPREADAIAGVLLWSAALGRIGDAALVRALAEIEGLIAAHAALRAGPEDVRRCERAARSDDASQRDSLFHEVLTECAGNEMLGILRRALAEAVGGRAGEARAAGRSVGGNLDHVAYSHAYIVDAVRTGDAAEASRRARRHIEVVLET
ncbi:MAG: FCD domain-containing protein [Actinobacteria bacterium]|nr:FCD domain-containing protein [Actinomycetota bacterium]